MGKIVVGLAQNKVSFFDKRMNLNFTLSNPVREVHFTNADDIQDIVRGLISTPPTLVLYSGEIPSTVAEAVHKRFDSIIFGKDVVKKDLSGDFVVEPAANVMDRFKNRVEDKVTIVDEAVQQVEKTSNRSTKVTQAPTEVKEVVDVTEEEVVEEEVKTSKKAKVTKANTK